METTSKYKTKQRELLERALKESGGEHITVDSLTDRLEKSGSAVGRTTVYRYLEALAKQGTVRKYMQTGENCCYQYVGESGCREHFHLKCEQCGRLFHIECDHLSELSSHIKASHGFGVNKLKTVLYGVCEDCEAE